MNEPLTTDVEGVYVSGGALEPMNIKDSILTGFGAGMLALRGRDFPVDVVQNQDKLYKESEPEITVPESGSSYLFYIGTEDAASAIFYEYISSRFIALGLDLKKAGKAVYMVTRNMVTPSYAELEYERAGGKA